MWCDKGRTRVHTVKCKDPIPSAIEFLTMGLYTEHGQELCSLLYHLFENQVKNSARSEDQQFFTAPSGPRAPHCRSLETTLRHTTLGRTPLDEWSARRRDLYLTTHNSHKRQTSMPPAGFETEIPASELPQTPSYYFPYGIQILLSSLQPKLNSRF
jgi:hypothetical protein